MSILGRAAQAAIAAAVSVGLSANKGFQGLSRYTTGDRGRKRAAGSIAQRNRWTGKPHEDKRAMARLERQEARKASK
jgi:hypothetical protein